MSSFLRARGDLIKSDSSKIHFVACKGALRAISGPIVDDAQIITSSVATPAKIVRFIIYGFCT